MYVTGPSPVVLAAGEERGCCVVKMPSLAASGEHGCCVVKRPAVGHVKWCTAGCADGDWCSYRC